MATIKSYTDIEQSKKLAEILPLESADMNYNNMCTKGVMYSNPYSAGLSSYNDASRKNQENIDFYLQGEDYKGVIAWEILPCWSLASLLEVIPQEIFNGEYIINITEGIGNKWIISYDHHENRNHSYYGLSTGADNLIDACYEMIIRLHEFKKL